MKNNVEVKIERRAHWYHNWLQTYELKFYVFLIVPSISEEYSLSVNNTINYLTIGFHPEFHRF